MSEWWQQPYTGGPMALEAKYFPRPLYPPKAAPAHTLSKPGPDVMAYKRIVCRLGRWEPWNPSGWDQDFNDKFSQGRGTGNVGDSGVRGFQRQMKIQDTGFIGKSTFNTLMSCRVPEGRQSAGEMAADPYSCSLLMQAFEIYGGKVEPPPPKQTPREAALDHMQKRLGYTEDPAGTNCDNRSDGIRTSQDHTAGGGTWLRYQPWCGCWCYYAMEAAGVERIDSSLASVSQIQQYAKSASKCYRGWTTDRSKVKPGDLVTMGGAAHVEMVRGFDGSNTLTYGGNTSAGTSGSQSNGGGAYARTRYPGEIDGYALVRYPGE